MRLKHFTEVPVEVDTRRSGAPSVGVHIFQGCYGTHDPTAVEIHLGFTTRVKTNRKTMRSMGKLQGRNEMGDGKAVQKQWNVLKVAHHFFQGFEYIRPFHLRDIRGDR
jgi:hypothetical protein